MLGRVSPLPVLPAIISEVPVDSEIVSVSTAAMTTDLALTWNSISTQIVNPTVDDLSVILPGASGAPRTGKTFTIQNVSIIWLKIKDSAGLIVGWVPPRDSTTMEIYDPAGTPAWKRQTNNPAEAAGVYSEKAISTATVPWGGAGAATFCGAGTWLSSTLFVIAYTNVGTGDVSVIAYSLIAGVLRMGAVVSVLTSPPNATFLKVRKLTATTFIVAYNKTTTTVVGFRAGSVNASTLAITLGTEVSGPTMASNASADLELLSATLALFCYDADTSNDLTAVTITISGVTLTVNTGGAGQIEAGAAPVGIVIVPKSATLAHVSYERSAATTALKCTRITVSGTTPTGGTLVSVSATGATPRNMIGVSATESIVWYTTASASKYTLNAKVITDGTPVTLSAAQDLMGGLTDNIADANEVIQPSNSRAFLVVRDMPNAGVLMGFTYTAGTVAADLLVDVVGMPTTNRMTLASKKTEVADYRAIWVPLYTFDAGGVLIPQRLYLTDY